MNRRAYLAAGLGLLAGCSTDREPASNGAESSGGTQAAPTDAIVVGPDGTDQGAGNRESPLATIQRALDQARPGDTILVLPGEYHEFFRTRRRGEPEEPITLTGPEDAVSMEPEDQRVICGNEVTRETQAEPGASCPSEVPGGDGIGHTGGDSPW